MSDNNQMEDINESNNSGSSATFAGPNPKAKLVNLPPTAFNKFMANLKRHLIEDNVNITPEMQESINKFTSFGQKTKDGGWVVNNEKRKSAPLEYKVLTTEELELVKANGLDARLEDLISCIKQNVSFLYETDYMTTMVEFILKFKSISAANNSSGDGDPNITCRDFTYETNLLSRELKTKMTKVKLPFLWAMIQVVWELTRLMPDVVEFIEGRSVWNKIEFLVNSQLTHRPEDAIEIGRFDSRFNRKNLKIIYSKNKIEQLIRLVDLEKSIPRITKRAREGGEEGLALYASVKRVRSSLSMDNKQQEDEEDIKLMNITPTGYEPKRTNIDAETTENDNGTVIILCSPRSGFFMEKTKQRKSDQIDKQKMIIDSGEEEEEEENNGDGVSKNVPNKHNKPNNSNGGNKDLTSGDDDDDDDDNDDDNNEDDI